MHTRNVHLTEQFDEFIETSVHLGRFSDASEQSLRLLEERAEEDKAKTEWLRGAIQEGIDVAERGDYTILSSTREIRELVHSPRTT